MPYEKLESRIREWGPGLMRCIAKRCKGDQQWAEEVYAETCLRAVRFWGTFKGGSLDGWLLEIARNVMFDQARKRSVRRRFFEEYADLEHIEVPAPDNAEDLMLQAERAEQIEEALQRAEPYQQVLLRDWLAGMAYKDIAKLHQMPMNTVKSRINRGTNLILTGKQEGRKPAWFSQWLKQEGR